MAKKDATTLLNKGCTEVHPNLSKSCILWRLLLGGTTFSYVIFKNIIDIVEKEYFKVF